MMFSEAETESARVGDRTFVRRCLIILLIVAVATVLWTAKHALVLLFGAVLFAIIFRGLAGLLRRVAPMPDAAAVATVLIMLALLLVGFGWVFGSQVSSQFSQVAERIPNSLAQVEDWLAERGWGQDVLQVTGGLAPDEMGSETDGARTGQSGEGRSEDARSAGDAAAGGEQPQSGDGGGISSTIGGNVGWLVQKAGSIVMTMADALAQVVLVIFGAVFLAFEPRLYRVGVRKLVPHDKTGQLEKVMDRTGNALWLWAAGALVEMIIVGILTGVGLWLIGVPAPLALGLIAGVLEFIPFVGPVLAAVPGILLALTVSPALALWTLLFYVALQQLEGNVILPLIQRKAVALPPVVAIFAILVFGSVFGVIGVLFAVPLAVAALTVIQVLYVRDTLHKPVHVEGT